MLDPWAEQMKRVVTSVRDGHGALHVDLRRAILDGDHVAEPLGAYLRKVVAAPGEITDADMQALLAAGFSEDQIFDATVSATLGAGLVRLDAGLDALRQAADED